MVFDPQLYGVYCRCMFPQTNSNSRMYTLTHKQCLVEHAPLQDDFPPKTPGGHGGHLHVPSFSAEPSAVPADLGSSVVEPGVPRLQDVVFRFGMEALSCYLPVSGSLSFSDLSVRESTPGLLASSSFRSFKRRTDKKLNVMCWSIDPWRCYRVPIKIANSKKLPGWRPSLLGWAITPIYPGSQRL